MHPHAHSRGVDAQNLALLRQANRCHDYDMSAVKRQSSELRDEYAALTRQRIVAAFVESLEDETSDDVSMAVIAKRANVAERTIYRHFKTRAELLAAAGEWIEDNVFGYVPFCGSADAKRACIGRDDCRRWLRDDVVPASRRCPAARRPRGGCHRNIAGGSRDALAAGGCAGRRCWFRGRHSAAAIGWYTAG